MSKNNRTNNKLKNNNTLTDRHPHSSPCNCHHKSVIEPHLHVNLNRINSPRIPPSTNNVTSANSPPVNSHSPNPDIGQNTELSLPSTSNVNQSAITLEHLSHLIDHSLSPTSTLEPSHLAQPTSTMNLPTPFISEQQPEVFKQIKFLTKLHLTYLKHNNTSPSIEPYSPLSVKIPPPPTPPILSTNPTYPFSLYHPSNLDNPSYLSPSVDNSLPMSPFVYSPANNFEHISSIPSSEISPQSVSNLEHISSIQSSETYPQSNNTSFEYNIPSESIPQFPPYNPAVSPISSEHNSYSSETPQPQPLSEISSQFNPLPTYPLTSNPFDPYLNPQPSTSSNISYLSYQHPHSELFIPSSIEHPNTSMSTSVKPSVSLSDQLQTFSDSVDLSLISNTSSAIPELIPRLLPVCHKCSRIGHFTPECVYKFYCLLCRRNHRRGSTPNCKGTKYDPTVEKQRRGKISNSARLYHNVQFKLEEIRKQMDELNQFDPSEISDDSESP